MHGNGDGKKVVCLGMPCYGEMTAGAAVGLLSHARSKSLAVETRIEQSSLLAQNMNILWTWALNRAQKDEPIDYFAMQHADIEPKEGWLEMLVAELEEKKLDVLGVVAPIKDQRGVTSIAMARKDGDPWRVHGRLTMKEIHRLPETFTSDDLGYPLLLNTGLWVCKFDIQWAYAVCFTVNDRICYDKEKKIWFVQVEPEDWNLSRQFHKLGLKVGCTRNVELGHRGTVLFGNTQPWGPYEYDQEYLTESAIPREVADWFPADVAGWLSEDEGKELARLAAGKVVLEIGAYCGRSTICLAQKARSVGTIDPFDGRGTEVPGETFQLFSKNVTAHGVANRVNVLHGTSEDILPSLPPVYDLVFIDGAHDRESVLRDAELATAVLKPGGVLVFHDYSRPATDFGVTQAVNEVLGGGATLLSRCDSLAVVRPAPAETLVSV